MLPYVGPNHCFYTNSDCSGGFSAAAKSDNCCFSMGFDGLSYKDADNLCIPCDSIGKWGGDESIEIAELGKL